MSNNNYERQPMVNWFSPRTLYDAAIAKVKSEMFGKFADRRLIHAALDEIKLREENNQTREYDLTGDFSDKDIENNKTDNKGIWIDYVADLGDGFNPTYAIAYLLAQDNIELNGNILKRGDILIMGGDEVYPKSTRDDYKNRLEGPYADAFPEPSDNNDQEDMQDKNGNGSKWPKLFMLPGNHDWYDGLTLFLAKYCRGEHRFPRSGWFLSQRRSYFAIKLPNDWWIWGIDSQLGEDIDQPQVDYFRNVIKNNPTSGTSKFILCTPVPSWLHIESNNKDRKEHFNRVIKYIASNIIEIHSKNNFKIYVVIAGDLHHYSRYKGGNNEN